MEHTDPKREVLLTVDDVATMLQASRSWVYAKAQSGELPSVKLAGLLRFRAHDVNELIEKASR